MIRVGITQGDINGIGLEVIIKTFLEPGIVELFTPVLFSSQRTVSFHRKMLNIEDFSFNQVRDLDSLNTHKANLINVYEEEVAIELGKSTSVGGQYALKSLEAACLALQQNKIDVLVTAPFNKHNIQSDTFNFPGHTEYLDQKFGNGNSSLMLMVSDTMRIGVVTGHIPLNDVASHITTEKILKKIDILNKSLIEDFGIRKPKIAILGLNPHAGDQGTLGKEEQTIILPAIEKAKEQNKMVFGPYSADGFFGTGSYLKFDAVLAMYHDQGLVPFKALSFNSGVNYTAGLSIIRTSPDHGTGFDIAGQNKANEESFRKAIYTACDIFKSRNEYKAISANPLAMTAMRRERRDN